MYHQMYTVLLLIDISITAYITGCNTGYSTSYFTCIHTLYPSKAIYTIANLGYVIHTVYLLRIIYTIYTGRLSQKKVCMYCSALICQKKH